jgi:hypothetical protein
MRSVHRIATRFETTPAGTDKLALSYAADVGDVELLATGLPIRRQSDRAVQRPSHAKSVKEIGAR